jgi:hypothetical protein|tara:strand:+ start:621 stop:779 length:159 start_codon:yes stop_codon:yes gene_type:complete
MIAIIRPILFNLLGSRRVHKLLVDMLEALAKRTDNTLDDQAVAIVRANLLKD